MPSPGWTDVKYVFTYTAECPLSSLKGRSTSADHREELTGICLIRSPACSCVEVVDFMFGS